MTLKNYTVNIKTKLYKVVEVSGHNINEAIGNLKDFINDNEEIISELLLDYDKKRFQFQVLDIEKIEEIETENECDFCDFSCPSCGICIYPRKREH